MKLLIVFFLSLLVLTAADGNAKKNPAPAAATRSASAPKEIPAGAVKSGDGSYYYTDRQGKKWIYRKTPFGLARFEDKPANPDERADSAKRYADVKATQDGDLIRFERPGPFGTYKWQRKKTDLNEMEQIVWDRERSRNARQD